MGEPLLWYTAIQGTPPFRGHKIWLWKNVYIIFVFFTSIEGTPLFRGKGHYLWVPKPRVNLHWGYTLPLKKWLTTKITDNFKCTLVKNGDSFQSMQYLSDLLHLWEFKTQHHRYNLIMIFLYLIYLVEIMTEKYFICWLIINNPQPNIHEGAPLFIEHLPWSWGCPLNGESTVLLK